MKTHYDVVVVGAGPAGSVAAMKAAAAGLKVLLVEKRQEIGVPVRCGEAISSIGAQAYIDINPRWINAHIDYYAIHGSDGACVRVPPTEDTIIIDRKVFDYELALNAARAGADVRVSTTATGLVHDDAGTVCGVHIKGLGREHTIRARLVIAADGTESQVARWAGLKTIPPLAEMYSGIQFLLSGMGHSITPNVCEYHFSQSYAPGGYIWVFPKGPDTANVGIVMSSDRTAGKAPQAYLEEFVARRYRGVSILSVVTGGIPITGAIKKMVTDGLMVAGDAAHQADPMTAGGINLGMIGADLAIQTAIPALEQGDVSRDALKPYEAAWQSRFGRMHKALHRLRKLLINMEEERFNSLVRTASQMPLETMSSGDLLLALLKNHPRMMVEATTLIATGLILK